MLNYAIAEKVISQIHHKWLSGYKILGDQNGMGEPLGLLLVDELNSGIPLPAGHNLLDLVPVGADDDSYLPNACLNQVLYGIEEYWLVGYWYELLLLRVCQRPQPGPVTTRKDQTFHLLSIPVLGFIIIALETALPI